MAEADHLRIVFRLGSLGVVMPVVSLLAICGPDSTSRGNGNGVSQTFLFRGCEIPVYDLADFLCREPIEDEFERSLLVFVGAEQPWAIKADEVEGVSDEALFSYRELPAHLFREGAPSYRLVAIHSGEPLISFDAFELEQALSGWRTCA